MAKRRRWRPVCTGETGFPPTACQVSATLCPADNFDKPGALEGGLLNGRERDEGDRTRRQAAVLRFLSAMHDIAGERDLVQALIQASAVWFDLDARAYRRELTGGFIAEMWLPGAQADGYPREIACGDLELRGAPRRLSSMADLDRLGWSSFQSEVLLLPLAGGPTVNWVIVVAGQVGQEAEAMLTVACRTAGAIVEHLAERRSRALEGRLRLKLAGAGGSVGEAAQAALEELVRVSGASAARLHLDVDGGAPPLTLAEAGSVPPDLLGGSGATGGAGESAGRVVLSAEVGVGRVARLGLVAGNGARFDTSQVRLAEAGFDVLAAWLGGVAAATRNSQAARANEKQPLEAAIGDEMDWVRRLSLRGGVLVASFGAGESAGATAVSSVIEAMRDELRSSDLLGQLAGGEVAALLVRATSDGVLSAAWRVRKRLEQVTRDRRLPPVVLGHALYPAQGAETLGALVHRARSGNGSSGVALFG